MLKSVSRVFEVPARAWCKMMHRDPMWPVAGYYRCPDCLRQYPVPWEYHPPTEPAVNVSSEQPHWQPAAAPAMANASIRTATAS